MSSESAPLTGTPPPTLRAEFGATLALAWPLAAANLLQMMVHAIDVIFVARLGDTSLAAASLGIAIFGLLLWTGTGLVGAAAPLIAAELGQRNHAVREVRRTVRMALWLSLLVAVAAMAICAAGGTRSEEHTSELQSLMRISYAVFCLKKKTTTHH